MVAIEAAAHGTPTVAFATGGIIDAVEDEVSGLLAEKSNYKQLEQKTIQMLKKPLERHKMEAFTKKFLWENFGENCFKVIKGEC